MARRKRRTYSSDDRNATGIENISVSLVCVNCKRRTNTNLMFVPKKLSCKDGSRLVNLSRCKFCKDQYQITYNTKKTKKGLYLLKVFEFIQCNAQYRKKFWVKQTNGESQGERK